MRLSTTVLATACTLTFAGLAQAQAPTGQVAPAPGTAGPAATGTVAPAPNTTGNNPNVTIAPGPTGASTIQTDSAAGSNAGQPSRAVPQGSGGSGNR
ncbi:hypothetical protein [Methylobacterium isbiliense]|jgi:hypothetical protein|uniref:Uncharacterized protein n=1 Tax=Methylobacterium isbiliense TaxID=315478 RepID=A0ABQ4SB41_9HYPH|nr:hypothetical protein [Methylobacterium isbiliense]MDN3621893.1 hypothetical protein [Methylobacterium isbiliense]GJD99592.1 hypothetical protein GMJLKIPL_1510 [Methylobacterium isbiliense]